MPLARRPCRATCCVCVPLSFDASSLHIFYFLLRLEHLHLQSFTSNKSDIFSHSSHRVTHPAWTP